MDYHVRQQGDYLISPRVLKALDQRGYDVVEAVRRTSPPGAYTYAFPSAFECSDGATYWLKAWAQEGLAAELIAGRLAVRAKAGPAARVVHVSAKVLPEDRLAAHLGGLVVGIENQPGAINTRDIRFDTESVHGLCPLDSGSAARVVAFQSWLGIRDPQALLVPQTGAVLSIDHGDCFSAVDALVDPVRVSPRLPLLEDDDPRQVAHMEAALVLIESITDDDLLVAVTSMPSGPAWQSDFERRLKIAKCLAHRRDQLRLILLSGVERRQGY